MALFPQVHFVTTVLPFVDSDDKLKDVLRQIKEGGQEDGSRPIVFVTFVNADYRKQIDQANALVVDVFSSFMGLLSRELNLSPSWQAGYSHGVNDQLRCNVSNSIQDATVCAATAHPIPGNEGIIGRRIGCVCIFVFPKIFK